MAIGWCVLYRLSLTTAAPRALPEPKQEAQHLVAVGSARAGRVRVAHQHAPQLRGERLKQKAKGGAREAADAHAGASAGRKRQR